MGDFAYHLPDEFREFLRDAGYSSIHIDVLESKNWRERYNIIYGGN